MQAKPAFTPEKVVKADAFPIGIDYNKFHAAWLTESSGGRKKDS